MATADPTTARECDCIGEIQTPLNACSLEVCRSSLVVGCYQLEEASQEQTTPTIASSSGSGGGAAAEADECVTTILEGDEGGRDDHGEENNNESAPNSSASKATRSGELRLYSIIPLSCSSLTSPSASLPKFGEPTQVVPMESGVLDSKWCPSMRGGQYLASACASGRIHVHELNKTERSVEDESDVGRFHLRPISSSVRDEDVESTRLALSLDWEKRDAASSSSDCTDTSRKIVSSYSDGSICIHSFHPFHPAPDYTSLIEEERWDAHTLFGCPSEVWTCCFAASGSTGQCASSNDGTNVVISGGDDCTMKLWDVRSGLTQPVAKVGNAEFEAGVTAVSYHRTKENMFAVGSYDEVVRLYDVRTLKEPLGRVNVGGGVWRIRWHPSHQGRMLVGAMHGGCRIVNMDDFAKPRIESQFTKHESMAYGADWIGEGSGGKYGFKHGEYAASCSFYDRRVCLWKCSSA